MTLALIPGLPQIGGAELLILLVIILLLFGAKRIPEIGRSLGSGIREFRKSTSSDYNEEEDKGRKEKEAVELPESEAARETARAEQEGARSDRKL